jgi:hypothetical protein
MICKLVYTDNNTTKVLKGIIEDDRDPIFVTLITEDKTRFKINKTVIISIKEEGV